MVTKMPPSETPAASPEIVQALKEAANLLDLRPISHAVLERTTNELFTRVSFAPRGTVFVLTGIGGVGVTRIARAVRAQCRRESQPFNPYAAIEIVARAPISSKFGWRRFFASALAAIDEPILGQRKRASESPDRVTAYTGLSNFRGHEDYRQDLEDAFQRRSCRMISVLHADFFLRRLPPEEVHHVLQLFDQMVSVRPYPSVALLSGRPELLKMIRNDSRSDLCVEVIEVPPLDTSTEEGLLSVLQMLAGFENLLSCVLERGTLTDHVKEICERTVGATGWIKRALSQAISDVLLQDRPRPLRWSDIKKRLPSKRATAQLHAELAEVARWRDYLESGDPPSKEGAEGTKSEPSNRGKGRRVGERGPSRDSVGEQNG